MNVLRNEICALKSEKFIQNLKKNFFFFILSFFSSPEPKAHM